MRLHSAEAPAAGFPEHSDQPAEVDFSQLLGGGKLSQHRATGGAKEVGEMVLIPGESRSATVCSGSLPPALSRGIGSVPNAMPGP